MKIIQGLYVLLLGMLLSEQAWSQAKTYGCSEAEKKMVTAEHKRASAYVKAAQKLMEQADPILKKSDLITSALKEVYDIRSINAETIPLLRRLQKSLKNIAENIDPTLYYCADSQDFLFCWNNSSASVPPPKIEVVLCPNFLKDTSRGMWEVGLLIHEQGHKNGGLAFDYYPETYGAKINNLPSWQRLRQSDALVKFVLLIAAPSSNFKLY
ncbi:MAG: hypothetical protein JNM93_01045 [Bacteriovoracaceae bacterium]|nr:hypothetical protein [Bacteriovoracaceae bacterium]